MVIQARVFPPASASRKHDAGGDVGVQLLLDGLRLGVASPEAGHVDHVVTAMGEACDGEIGLVPPSEFEDGFYRQQTGSTKDEALIPSLQ